MVLDPQYFGIVISTSARFYTLIRPLSSSSSNNDSIRIKVQAAQFPKDQSVWEYDLTLSDKVDLKPVAEKDEGNKFVQLTIDCALRYALEVVGEEGVRRPLGKGVEIVVLADNDFYSQSDKVSVVLVVFAIIETRDSELIYRQTLPSHHSQPSLTQSTKPTKQVSALPLH